MIHNPIVLDGTDVNAVWKQCKRQCDVLVESGGTDLRAAAGADPGIVSCPKCGTMHWNIGSKQECTQCTFQYPTDWWPMLCWGKQAGDRRHSVTTGVCADRIHHPVYHYAYLNHDRINVDFGAKSERQLLPWYEIIKQPMKSHSGKEKQKMIKAGECFYSIEPGLGEHYKCHVVAIVDENMVVYKWFGRRKRWWHYQVESLEQVEMRIERAAQRKE